MEQKLIFLDIDGTLLPKHATRPPDSALKAIQIARSKGHKIFLCTGRNMRRVAPIMTYGFDGVIASAGGYIVCNETVIHDQPIEEEQRNRLLHILRRNGVTCCLQTMDCLFIDSFWARLMWPGLCKRTAFSPMSRYSGQPVYKVSFLCKREEQLTEARESFGEQYSFCLGSINTPKMLGKINGEIIAHSSDKGAGVRRVCGHLGIPIENSISFGDSANDLSMVQATSVGVCMSNGCEELKTVCDKICPTAEQNGLAIGFQELGLI